MPLANRIVSVTGAEATEFRYRADAPWQLIAVDTVGAVRGLFVAAHDPARPWGVPGLDVAAGNASVLPQNAADYFLPLSISVQNIARVIAGLVGSTAVLGPLDRNGNEYAAAERITLGAVTNAENRVGAVAGNAPYDSRVDRWFAIIPTLAAVDNPPFSHRLGAQVTFRREPTETARFSAWAELLDVTASDQLEVTASGVEDTGQRYDVRLRVAHDPRWSTELEVTFDGLEYSVVSVAEDTERDARRYQIIGLRRLDE